MPLSCGGCATYFKPKLPKSPLTYFLFCVFGIGSWIAVNGVWAEITVLTLTLPECYKLAAILVVAIQIANVGPLAYTLTKYLFQRFGLTSKQIHLERVTVTLIVTIGVAACILLAIFWDGTATIRGQVHSVAMIVLTFFLALVDCTSSVVFIPFMKHFPEEYISALYIGEGLSGVLPSAVALSQGFVNNSIGCQHQYPGHQALGIHFSPDVFFIFLTVMMLICGVAFVAINVLPPVRKHMVHYKYRRFRIKGNSRTTTPAPSETNLLPNERRVLFGNDEEDDDEEEEVTKEKVETEEDASLKIMVEGDGEDFPRGASLGNSQVHIETELSDNDDLVTPPQAVTPPPGEPKVLGEQEMPKTKSRLPSIPQITSSLKFQSSDKRKNKVVTRVASGLVLNIVKHKDVPTFSWANIVKILWTNATIFVCLGLLNFMTNGVLSAVSPYIFLPYGNNIYHWAVNLALLANPVMSLFYVLVPYKSKDLTALMTGVALVLGIYLLTCAMLKPEPPLTTHILGKILIVVANVCVSALVSYTKVGVVVQLHAREADKDTALLLAGMVTQISSLIGAVLLFALVNFTQVF